MFRFFRERNSPMRIVVGLGNPGGRYSNTRHNVGFIAVNRLANNLTGGWRNKFQAEVGEAVIAGDKCLLVKPQTFMNLSGRSVREILNWYKLAPENLIVIYDDMDLALGKIRLRFQGGAGGHNGIKSIIGELGTDRFDRIKIGIGRPPEGWDPVDYVLSDLRANELANMAEVLEKVEGAVQSIISEGIIRAMNSYNS